MNELKEHICNWLNEIDENAAAIFLNDCEIEQIYIDTLFSMDSDIERYLYEVVVNVPLRTYKKLEEFSKEKSAIELAIRESGESSGIYVREIDWQPYLKNDQKKEAEKKAEAITNILSNEYVNKQIKLMNRSIEDNPHLSLGISKELIETCCKYILQKAGIQWDRDWDIAKLVKEVNKQLNLLPFEVENAELGKTSVAKILAGFSNIVHGIAELRNSFGTGHGHSPDFKSLDLIYIKLAVAASSELAIFYLSLEQLRAKKEFN